MTPPQAILSVFRNYANFEGRACRSEYWWFYLFYVVLLVAIFVASLTWTPALLAVWIAYLVAVGPALMSVTVRRLHDVDRSGGLALLGFLPFAGGPRLTRILMQPGTEGPNRYGPDPLRPESYPDVRPESRRDLSPDFEARVDSRREPGRSALSPLARPAREANALPEGRVPPLRLDGPPRRLLLRRLRRPTLTQDHLASALTAKKDRPPPQPCPLPGSTQRTPATVPPKPTHRHPRESGGPAMGRGPGASPPSHRHPQAHPPSPPRKRGPRDGPGAWGISPSHRHPRPAHRHPRESGGPGMGRGRGAPPPPIPCQQAGPADPARQGQGLLTVPSPAGRGLG